jgi:medium-chain acyl-[acyl-carrier-protein] hydrolase
MNLISTLVFPIHTYELDPAQRLSIFALACFLQEAAGHNAHGMGFSPMQLMERGLTWVLSRLRIRLRELPGWKAQITVQTWPSGLDRLFALRDFRIFEQEREIGVATSGWLMLEARNRRPVRPDSNFDWRGLIHPERSLAVDLERVPGAEAGEPILQELELPVRYADLDMNMHANNTRYVEWLLEVVPLEVLRGSRLAELDIDFLAEAEHGERILSRLYEPEPQPPQGGRCFRHVLSRRTDGREVARARGLWL